MSTRSKILAALLAFALGHSAFADGVQNPPTAIPNSSLANSSITINGKSVSLGGSYGSTATLQGTPSNPTGTGATGQTMQGLGSTCAITPNTTGRIFVTFSFTHANAVSTTDTAALRFGTGTAPANAAGVTGTVAGAQIVMFEPTATASNQVAVSSVITGLTVSTAYWLDLSLATGSNGNIASLANVTCSAFEF